MVITKWNGQIWKHLNSFNQSYDDQGSIQKEVQSELKSILKLEYTPEPHGLLNQIVKSLPRNSDSQGLWWELSICIYDKLPGDVDGAGLETAFENHFSEGF